MKKKLLALGMVAALGTTAVVGGTLAYFTDAEQKTNVMEIGNVEINIDEYQKKADGTYEKFNDKDFTLYPIENAKGVQFRNKVVYTANTSPSEDAAYIRNIVLFEKNDLLTADYKSEADCCVPGLHFAHFNQEKVETSVINGKKIHSSHAVKYDDPVKIGDEEYWVVVFTDAKEEAIPHDEALYSLNAVWMDKNITSEQIAGWGTDKNVDIIVLSQGIQATGLSHEDAMKALGEVDKDNLNAWLNGKNKADGANLNDWHVPNNN